MKRLFDLSVAALSLVILSPLLAAIALAIRADSPGPIFHRGVRMGREMRPFRIFKFRTMVADAPQRGSGLTTRGDPRITRVGARLRRSKLDELPQLLNVLLGQMSLVGPRPEDPRYLPHYSQRQRQLLSVRPGMTSLASLRFRNEEDLLSPEAGEQLYISTILPAKLDIELRWLQDRSFGQDLLILAATLLVLLKDRANFDAWARRVARLEQLVARYASWVVVDMVLIILAYLLGIGIRSINARFDLWLALIYAVGGVAVYLFCNYLFGIYHRFWRYASAQESVTLFSSTALATLILTGFDLLLQERELPLGAIWMGGFFTWALLSAARYRYRLWRGAAQLLAGLTAERGARVLIVGAGEEGQLLAWQLQNRFQGAAYHVIGFIDDDRAKHGMLIHNARVHGGRHVLPAVAAREHVDLILIAIPPYKVHEPRELLGLCRATSAQIKILPSLFAWLGHQDGARGWEDARDDNFLQRTTYQVDRRACEGLLGGRVVLVTGAAGSIGSELCRQIAAFGPARLIMLDSNESGLSDLQLELRGRLPADRLRVALCDVTSAHALGAVFVRERPQIVFHAAAYKHVHILEAHPAEAIRVNIGGTRLAHALALAHGVERFILISTDKAVHPSSAYGVTKWLCELLVSRPDAPGAMRSSVVRFGNVLGSRGSVIPILERQIETGGPITITHPDATRYFLSIGEAVSLVLQAAALTEGGDSYILDMGTPIKIMDLAHRLIRMHGLRPTLDIAIEIVGLRPGEKLSEELVAGDERQTATTHPSVFRIHRCQPVPTARVELTVERLLALASDGASADHLRAELAAALTITGSEVAATVPLGAAQPAHGL